MDSLKMQIGYELAADEALKDANWIPTKQDEKERTGVSIGGGIGSMSDIVDAAQLICEKVDIWFFAEDTIFQRFFSSSTQKCSK
ncbi:3-oxoacyl-[acyl-carrier-protein] synthase, mitochondrial-like [Chenopodium quinoa]|uniref:3-oxoacyl-[acyl-carrier-protein] synthase, mitochondrial-like n=1 Tax=Chenopodium quinoa TaxID=63459 RepID=UPI000B78C40A|nr:3-oxoacyl-[acyl-carrier-protein] synthase, mitochondrial-like [Chenopodium quinoa]